jgi:hypothetical protein
MGGKMQTKKAPTVWCPYRDWCRRDAKKTKYVFTFLEKNARKITM